MDRLKQEQALERQLEWLKENMEELEAITLDLSTPAIQRLRNNIIQIKRELLAFYRPNKHTKVDLHAPIRDWANSLGLAPGSIPVTRVDLMAAYERDTGFEVGTPNFFTKALTVKNLILVRTTVKGIRHQRYYLNKRV